MSILGRIRNMNVTDPKAWNRSLWNFAGSQSPAGENVTEESALTYSAVFNAVSLIAGTCSSLPLHLMKRSGRSRSVLEDKPLYGVMHDQANPYMTAMSFREAMTAHVLTWGNGYAEIVRNTYGQIVELWPIPPNRVINIRMDGGRIVYDINVDSETVTLPKERVLHVPGLGFDGFTGYSVISLARKSIGLGMAMETFGSMYFGNGTHPGLVVSHPGKLSPVGSSNLKSSLATEYGGLGKAHKLLLLEEGMKVEKIGIPPNDSQFLESRQFQIPEIARWFNLPPHKLKDLTRSSFNNIEAEQISFVTDSILPWLIRFEQNYNMQLLSKDEKTKEHLHFKHIVEGLLRGDSKSRSEYYKNMISVGLMTINEGRAKEDFNPSDEEFADDLFVPMNTIPISMLRATLERGGSENPAEDENDNNMDNESYATGDEE